MGKHNRQRLNRIKRNKGRQRRKQLNGSGVRYYMIDNTKLDKIVSDSETLDGLTSALVTETQNLKSSETPVNPVDSTALADTIAKLDALKVALVALQGGTNTGNPVNGSNPTVAEAQASLDTANAALVTAQNASPVDANAVQAAQTAVTAAQAVLATAQAAV